MSCVSPQNSYTTLDFRPSFSKLNLMEKAGKNSRQVMKIAHSNSEIMERPRDFHKLSY